MLNAVFRPILTWPGRETPSYNRRQAPFRSKYNATLDLLEHELVMLGAKDIVIQADFALHNIRNDGWPRSGARPDKPRVIVTFQGRTGPLSFPCDAYTVWEDNLRAIALALQALRAVDRYGVTRNNEQYKGWTPLPAPADAAMSKEEAAHMVAGWAGGWANAANILASAEIFGRAYRIAAARVHPDNPGGSHELFVKLQTAREVLKRVHGGAGV